MAFELHNLDDKTRHYMIAELDSDLANHSLYVGKYLSDEGLASYPSILRRALENGTDASLSTELAVPGLFRETYEKRKPSGGYTTAKVPYTAPTTLAEGEFNRFYLRGLCRRVLENGGGEIEIYRARVSSKPRPESEAMVGRRLDAQALLNDLRHHIGVDTALGLPPGPNSGLSGRIVVA